MNYLTLDQWRAFAAVVDHGGYARAAEALAKSQSSVSYAVSQIEQRTGVRLFRTVGRRAVLTPQGQALFLRAKSLLADAARVEGVAASMARGHEAELRLAAEILFPPASLLDCLNRFTSERPSTRLEVYETVVGGALELLTERRVDLAISPDVPDGFLGEPLITVRFLPVAAPSHPLHALERVTLSDLRDHRHLIIRDSGSRRDKAGAWNVAQNRVTFSQTSTSIEAARRGLGFGWYAEPLIANDLASGTLKILPLNGGGERSGQLYLVLQDAEGATPGVKHMAQIIRDVASSYKPSAQETFEAR